MTNFEGVDVAAGATAECHCGVNGWGTLGEWMCQCSVLWLGEGRVTAGELWGAN